MKSLMAAYYRFFMCAGFLLVPSEAAGNEQQIQRQSRRGAHEAAMRAGAKDLTGTLSKLDFPPAAPSADDVPSFLPAEEPAVAEVPDEFGLINMNIHSLHPVKSAKASNNACLHLSPIHPQFARAIGHPGFPRTATGIHGKPVSEYRRKWRLRHSLKNEIQKPGAHS